MFKCPKCGAETSTPMSTWDPVVRGSVVIGLFKCPNGHYFKAVVKKNTR